MPLPITAVYAALLALVGVALQQLVGRERLRAGVSLGDGGNPTLLTAMRRQTNFVEQVPMALILLLVLELNGLGAVGLHALGAGLVAARVIHPFGLDAGDLRRLPRLIGAVGTLAVVLVASALLLGQGLRGA